MKSLKSAIAEVQNHDEFSCVCNTFIKDFSANPDLKLIEEEPELLSAKLHDTGLADAFLASIIAYLCQIHPVKQPLWPDQRPRIMKTPWFASDIPRMRAYFLRKSPAAFRVRNLFVPPNVMQSVSLQKEAAN